MRAPGVGEVDRTVASPRGVRIAAGGGALLVLLLGIALHAWWARGAARPADLVILLGLLTLIAHRSLTRCTCELREDGARFTSRGPLRSRVVDVPYARILGVYPYRPRLLSPLRYRRTFRMHALVDARDVWSLAFRAAGGRRELRCVQFKCDERWLDALAALAPRRVRVSEEHVAAESLRGD